MDYDVLIEKIQKLLLKTHTVVLATSSKDGVVSASKMCVVSDGVNIYFQTDERFEKALNIMENPNVAININNVYFKGQAHIIGRPPENAMFISRMIENHYQAYENYSFLPHQILVSVELTECRIWGFWADEVIPEQKEEAIKVLDLKNKNLSKVKCDNLKGVH